MIEVRVMKVLGSFVLNAELKDEGLLCLTGGNGSGKSTILGIIAGTQAPDEGHVLVNSRDVTRLPIEKRETVLVTPESSIPHLNVDTHIAWGARARRARINRGYVDEVKAALGITFPGRVGQLSLGMRARVALATALVSKPKVILVDETFSSLDNREEFIRNYNHLCAESRIDVLFATQNSETDARLADHVYKMDNGRSTRLM